MNEIEPILNLLQVEAVFVAKEASGYAIPVTKRAIEFTQRYRDILKEIGAVSFPCRKRIEITIPKSREYRELRTSNTDLLDFAILMQFPLDQTTLVSVHASESYSDLQARTDIIATASELCPHPFSLIRLDPVTGQTHGMYASNAYCEVYGMSHELFMRLGVRALTARALPEDRKLSDIYVPACIKVMQESVIIMRVLTKTNVYRWFKQWASVTLAPDGQSVYGTCQVEDFDETAKLILRSMKENRAAMMLMSLGQTVFDFCACLDRKMRILILSDKAKNWLLRDPEKLATGAPFESFISLDQHKLNFRNFLEARLKEAHTMVGVWPCKVRMNLINNRLAEVSVVVMPLQSKDLVLCHSLSATGISSPATRRLLIPAEVETCFYMGCTLVDRSALKKSLIAKKPKTSSSSSSLTPKEAIESSSSPNKGKFLSIVTSLFWVLMRDLSYSLSLVSKPSDGFDWYTPVFRFSYPEVELEELTRLLPNNLQSEFVQAANRADFSSCSQLLSYSMEGNANILSPGSSGSSRGGQLVINKDIVRCAFRFFLSFVPKLSHLPARQFALLSELDDSRKFLIARRLDRSENILLLYHFTLVLISTAHQSVQYFSTDRCVQWLRNTFSEFLTAPEIEHVHPGSKLATAYWTCVLWASLMHAMGRNDEAVATLTQTTSDMDIYFVQHPFVACVRELQCIALKNLCTFASERSQIDLLVKYKQQLNVALTHARMSGAHTNAFA